MSEWLRVLGVVVLALTCACAPPAAPPATEAPPAAVAATDAQAVLDVLTPIVAAEIGTPVQLNARTTNVVGDWAYISAVPVNATGGAIDWSATNLASRYEHGAMDESGAVHALLRKESGVWIIVENVIAPTDVAWATWTADHNVPAGVVDVPAAQ